MKPGASSGARLQGTLYATPAAALLEELLYERVRESCQHRACLHVCMAVASSVQTGKLLGLGNGLWSQSQLINAVCVIPTGGDVLGAVRRQKGAPTSGSLNPGYQQERTRLLSSKLCGQGSAWGAPRQSSVPLTDP